MKNILFSALFVLLFFSYAPAQEQLGYQLPKKELLDLVDVDLAPQVLSNSKNTVLVLISRSTYKSISDLSKKELRIAGLRVDPKRFIGSRTTYYNKVQLIQLAKGTSTIEVSGLPEKPQLTNFSWSPDEKKIAMTHTSENGVELWVLDIESRKARRVIDKPINASMGSSIAWLKNSKA
ncbi:S9 family peptidase, partial [Flavobacteriaceae bacterium]|nr:S9 family peptidase [Flavobacteriaceae bacterium]